MVLRKTDPDEEDEEGSFVKEECYDEQHEEEKCYEEKHEKEEKVYADD